MAASGKPTSRRKRRITWRRVKRIALGIIKGFLLLVVVAVVIDSLLGDGPNPAGHLSSIFVIALASVSLAYWLFVSSRVRMSLPGIEAGQEAEVTVQVLRLSSDAARVSIVNEAPLPVLRAQMELEIVPEPEGGAPTWEDLRREKSPSFSMRARSISSFALPHTFEHVGICWMRSTGVRIHDLLGVCSCARGTPGQWRIRIVPNIYRLPYGIPRERRVMQSSLGIGEAPADALDYDRVRDYRYGDPLKTIHWKLVAHGQGELYTKLFETPTISTVTLVIDPYGPEANASLDNAACHLHDTMLEGGLSLVEHARETGIAGRLRFIDRAGSLVEKSWTGPTALGWFVETMRRPTATEVDKLRSVMSIRSLRDGPEGYVIFATSGLTDASVEELIACHHAGVPLLVVHALPVTPHAEDVRQRSYDARLREASIGVVALTDGPQIVREVMAPWRSHAA